MIRVYVDTNIDASVLLLVDASTKIADLKKQVEQHIAQEYSGGPVGAGKQKIERMNCLFDPISPSRSRENCFTVPDGYNVGSIATDGTAKLFAEYQHAAPPKGGAFVTPVPGDRKRGRIVPVETSNGIVKEKKMKKTDAKETPVVNARGNVEKVQIVGEVGTTVEPVAESGGLQRTPSSKTLKNQKKREQRKRRRESAKKSALEEEKPVGPAVVQKDGKPKEKSKEKANVNDLLGSGEKSKQVDVNVKAIDRGKKAQAGQQSPKKVAAVGKEERTGKTSSKKQEQTLYSTGAKTKKHSPSSSSSSESSSSSSEEAVEPIEPAKAKSKPMAEQKKKVPEIPKKDKTTSLPKSKVLLQPAKKPESSSSSSSSESSSSSDSEGPVEPVKATPKAVTEQKQKEKDVPKKTEQTIKIISMKQVKTSGKSKVPEVPPEPILSSSSSSSESSKSTSSSSDSEDGQVEAHSKKIEAEIVKEKTKEKEGPKVKEAKHVGKPTPPMVAAKDPSSSSESSSSSSDSSDSEEMIPKSNEKQKVLTNADKSGVKPNVVKESKKKPVQESSSDASTSEDSSESDSASSSSSSDSESDAEHSKEGKQEILTPSGKFDESDGRILKHLLASASQPDASKVCVADLKKSARLEQEQDDLKKKMESESKTYQWQKPFSSFSRESLLKLCRMMVRDAVNQERKAKGLEEAQAAKLYKDENRPDWWPLHKFSASSFDKKKDAVAVYNATRKVLSAIYRVDLEH